MLEDPRFHYIISPTLEMRKNPDDKSEVVSQGLFSENIVVLEEQKNWALIKTLIDNYPGWVNKQGIYSRTTSIANENGLIVTTNRIAAQLYEHPDTIYGPMLTLPFESRLAVADLKDEHPRWLQVTLPDFRKAYIQCGDVTTKKSKMNFKEMCLFSQFFLGLPYTWGGRSSFGYDCSGFVQMLYRQMGIFLPRDSQDQFDSSNFIECPIEVLTEGNLIFWGFSNKQIRHVGIYLGEGKFIHTSAVTENMPYIRISHVNDPAWNGSGHYPFISGKCFIKMTRA